MKRISILISLFIPYLFVSCDYIADQIWSKYDVSYENNSSYKIVFLDTDNSELTLDAGQTYTFKGYGYPKATLLNTAPVDYSSEAYRGIFTDKTAIPIVIKNTKNENVVFKCGDDNFKTEEVITASSEKTIAVFSSDNITVLSENENFAIPYTSNTVDNTIFIYI